MTSRSDAVLLSVHEDSLQRYLYGIAGRFDSVAGLQHFSAPGRWPACVSMRPALQLWAAAANGAALEDALPIAAAFDLFDQFMLLHDELADAKAMTIGRWGLGPGLNAGDALYALAFRMLAGDVVQPSRRLAAARLVGEAVLAALDGSDCVPSARCALTGAAMNTPCRYRRNAAFGRRCVCECRPRIPSGRSGKRCRFGAAVRARSGRAAAALHAFQRPRRLRGGCCVRCATSGLVAERRLARRSIFGSISSATELPRASRPVSKHSPSSTARCPNSISTTSISPSIFLGSGFARRC